MNWWLIIVAIGGVGLILVALIIAVRMIGPGVVLMQALEYILRRVLPPIAAQIAKDMANPEVDRRNKENAHKPNPQPMPSKFPKRDR